MGAAVHGDRTVRRPRRARRGTALLAGLTLAGALLAGCSGDDEPDSAGSSESGTPSASDSPYLPVPEGVELTAPGTQLKVGETATVAWEPRQDLVGVLEVTVDRLEKTTYAKSFRGWKLSSALDDAAPYFVRATVTNVGDTDLGGQRIPLYIVDGANTLVEYSSFASRFKPCPSGDFPKPFAAGATQQVCLVYLAPKGGDLTAVSFRPTQEFDPILWTGELQAPADQAAPKGKNNKLKKQRAQRNRN